MDRGAPPSRRITCRVTRISIDGDVQTDILPLCTVQFELRPDRLVWIHIDSNDVRSVKPPIEPAAELTTEIEGRL
jgi:hypothetical protein